MDHGGLDILQLEEIRQLLLCLRLERCLRQAIGNGISKVDVKVADTILVALQL